MVPVRAKLALTTAMLALMSPAFSQSGSIEMPSIAPTMLQILNPTSAKVFFQISCVDEDGKWDEMSLEPDANAQYYCEGSAPYLWFQLKSAVPGKSSHKVTYKLNWTQRYKLVYDSGLGKWELVHVTR